MWNGISVTTIVRLSELSLVEPNHEHHIFRDSLAIQFSETEPALEPLLLGVSSSAIRFVSSSRDAAYTQLVPCRQHRSNFFSVPTTRPAKHSNFQDFSNHSDSFFLPDTANPNRGPCLTQPQTRAIG